MRKRTRRKVFALVNPIEHARQGACITEQSALNKLRLRELSHLDAFKRGEPSIHDWRAMADLMNLSETLAKSGVGPEVLPVCERAQDALLAGYERCNAHGKIGRAAGEYETLLELYELHDLQRASISRSQYEQAIHKTMERLRSSRHPDVKVLA